AVDALQVVETEVVARPPGDHVIGAGRVAAHAETADDLVAGTDLDVEAQAAAEHVHAADAPADHGVVRLAVAGGVGRGAVGGLGVHRIAVLQTVEAAAERLDGRIEGRRGQRTAGEADGVRRVGVRGRG